MPVPNKVYVLDTSVLIKDPEAINRLEDNIIIIPIIVIQELERFKNESELRGASARKALRIIDEYRSQGSLREGVNTTSGGTLIVDCRDIEWQDLSGNLQKSNDLAILLTAIRYQKEKPSLNIILLTEDIALRIMAASFNIIVEAYKNSENIKRIEELSLGTIDIKVPVEQADCLNRLAHDGKLPIDVFDLGNNMYANQCCRLINPDGKYCLAIYKPYKGHFFYVLKPESTIKCPGNIRPVNDEQAFANALFYDPEIRIIAAGGVAGGGKTLLSLAAGNSQVGDHKYESLLVFRPTKQLGDDLGFLPGSLDEKFEPWQRPIIDGMKLIYNGRDKITKDGVRSSVVAELIRKGDLEIRPINFEQGGTLRGTFTIVDEAQNFDPESIKTLGTRNGEGSKMIFTGDLQQICRSARLDPTSSGLTHLIESLKGERMFAHITFLKSERDELAELCANRL